MNKLIISIITALILVAPNGVSAQATVTPPDFVCSWPSWTQQVYKFVAGLAATFPGDCAGGSSSAIVNAGMAAEKSGLYKSVATAAAIVNSLPDEINKAGPDGQALANAQAGSAQIFGYVKWMFSANSAQELLGKSLAPVGINIMVILTIVMGMAAAWVALNLAVYLVRFALWVVNQLLKFIPFMG